MGKGIACIYASIDTASVQPTPPTMGWLEDSDDKRWPCEKVSIIEIRVSQYVPMNKPNIPSKTILPVELQVARLLGLVKRVRIVSLPQRRRWGLLIEGRGFRRMLDAEIPHAAHALRPVPGSIPQARVFFSDAHARSCADSLGIGRLVS